MFALTSPVQEFKRNLRREYTKLVAVVQSYALISTGVRFTCSNQVLRTRPLD